MEIDVNFKQSLRNTNVNPSLLFVVNFKENVNMKNTKNRTTQKQNKDSDRSFFKEFKNRIFEKEFVLFYKTASL